MHYLAYSITKLCQCRKQWYEGLEGIPMYDCSGKEGVFIVIIKCGYLCLYAREWMCLDHLQFGVR